MENNEKYFIDFDKLFENYADKYYSAHEGEYDSPDDFARDLDKIYHEWATGCIMRSAMKPKRKRMRRTR